MPFEYINRRNKRYYLHQGITKTGKPRFVFSTKPEGLLAEALPEGYEVHESPNAQVSLRKIVPKIIWDQEVAVVRDAIKRFSDLKYYQIDVSKNMIVVYTGDRSMDTITKVVPIFFQFQRDALQEHLERSMTYTAMLRFILADPDTRQFYVQRYCFRGSIDDWIFISGHGELEELAATFVPHLGQDSFYELM